MKHNLAFQSLSTLLFSTVTIYIPATATHLVMENGKTITTSNDARVIGTEKEYVVLKVGSGKYQLSTSWKPIKQR